MNKLIRLAPMAVAAAAGILGGGPGAAIAAAAFEKPIVIPFALAVHAAIGYWQGRVFAGDLAAMAAAPADISGNRMKIYIRGTTTGLLCGLVNAVFLSANAGEAALPVSAILGAVEGFLVSLLAGKVLLKMLAAGPGKEFQVLDWRALPGKFVTFLRDLGTMTRRGRAAALWASILALIANALYVREWHGEGTVLFDFIHDNAKDNLIFLLVSSGFAAPIGWRFGRRVGEARGLAAAIGYGSAGGALVGLVNGTCVFPVLGSAIGAVIGAVLGVIAGPALFSLLNLVMPPEKGGQAVPDPSPRIMVSAALVLLVAVIAAIYIKNAQHG